MQVYRVDLRFAPEGYPHRLMLRQVCGSDELAIHDTSTASAIQLLNYLLTGNNDRDGNPVKAEAISTADRDLLLAAVYKNIYGSIIASTIKCNACRNNIDIDFSIDELIRHLYHPEKLPALRRESPGIYSLDNGARFRLPCGEDEMAVAGLAVKDAEAELLKRCLLSGTMENAVSVQQAMEAEAPVLQSEMSAVCPECGAEQQVRFDIQQFLLTRVKNGRSRLLSEVHRIAMAYHWRHAEILALPLSLRQSYADLIESGTQHSTYLS